MGVGSQIFLDPPPLHFKNILQYRGGGSQNILDPTPTLKKYFTIWGGVSEIV